MLYAQSQLAPDLRAGAAESFSDLALAEAGFAEQDDGVDDDRLSVPQLGLLLGGLLGGHGVEVKDADMPPAEGGAGGMDGPASELTGDIDRDGNGDQQGNDRSGDAGSAMERCTDLSGLDHLQTR